MTQILVIFPRTSVGFTVTFIFTGTLAGDLHKPEILLTSPDMRNIFLKIQRCVMTFYTFSQE